MYLLFIDSNAAMRYLGKEKIGRYRLKKILTLILTSLIMASCGNKSQESNNEALKSDIIINGESRTKVESLDSISDKVGHLFIYRNGKKVLRLCTATVIAKNYLITAAHCAIRSRKTDDQIEELYFELNPLDGDYKKQSWLIKEGFVSRTYFNEAEQRDGDGLSQIMVENDIAILKVEPKDGVSIGENLGTFELGVNESDNMALDTVVYGYPGDKPSGTMWKDVCYTKRLKAKFSWKKRYKAIDLLCDIHKGSSGSAVINYNSMNRPMITGVVSSESEEGKYNRAAPISMNNLEEIYNIINDYHSGLIFFKKINYKTDGLYEFIITSECDKEINVIAFLKNSQGWIEKVEKTIEPFKNVNIGKGVDSEALFTAYAKTLIWRGSERITYQGKDYYPLKYAFHGLPSERKRTLSCKK